MAQNIHKWLLFVTLTCVAFVAQAQTTARYHTVEEGQTLYSIARLYDIAPGELMKLNPEAGDFIKPGDKLRIPDNVTPKQQATGPGAQFATSGTNSGQGASNAVKHPGKDNCKEMYQIKKKDTMYRIAMDHNISVQELIDANPGLTSEGKLKKGEWLCIPFSKAEIQAEKDKKQAEKEAYEASVKKSNRNHISMAVILPLKEESERGAKMIEFYQGLLMAVDSVRKQGTSVDVYAYHSGSGLSELNDILAKEEMKGMDIVFGPLDGVQANTLSNFCQQNKIRLVMPFATTNTYAQNNPYAYIATASSDEIAKKGASMISQQFTNHSVVVLNTGTSDTRGSYFTNQLTQQLANRHITPKQISIEENDQDFGKVFSTSLNNLVVLNSSSLTAVQKTVKKLRTFAKVRPDIKITLIGYPEWSTYQGSILQDFYALDTYVFTNFFRNSADVRTQAYERRFKANFHNDLIKTSPRYGMMGMDMGYYFLHGLAKLGDNFESKQQSLNYKPLQHDLLFTTGKSKAYYNTNVSLVHFTPAGSIEVIRAK